MNLFFMDSLTYVKDVVLTESYCLRYVIQSTTQLTLPYFGNGWKATLNVVTTPSYHNLASYNCYQLLDRVIIIKRECFTFNRALAYIRDMHIDDLMSSDN